MTQIESTRGRRAGGSPTPCARATACTIARRIGSDEALRQSVVLFARHRRRLLIRTETGSGKEHVRRRSTAKARAAWAPTGPSSPSTAAPSPSHCWNRSCSATRTGPSRARAGAAMLACSKRPTTAPCSSTKSAKCRWPCKRACCACWKSAKWCAWRTRPVALNVRISAPRTATWRQRIREGRFRADMFYAWPCLRLHCPPARTRQRHSGLAEWSLKNALAALGARKHPNMHAEVQAARRCCAATTARQRARTAQPGRAPGLSWPPNACRLSRRLSAGRGAGMATLQARRR